MKPTRQHNRPSITHQGKVLLWCPPPPPIAHRTNMWGGNPTTKLKGQCTRDCQYPTQQQCPLSTPHKTFLQDRPQLRWKKVWPTTKNTFLKKRKRPTKRLHNTKDKVSTNITGAKVCLQPKSGRLVDARATGNWKHPSKTP